MRKQKWAKRLLISGIVIVCIIALIALTVIGINALIPEQEFRPLIPHRVLYTVKDIDMYAYDWVRSQQPMTKVTGL